MFPLIVATAFAAQVSGAPGEAASTNVEHTHDQTRNESHSVLTIARMYADADPWKFRADLALVYTWSGVRREPAKDDDRVQAVLVVRSRDGGFEADDARDLAILAGDQRIHAMRSDYVMDFLDEDIPTKEVEYRPKGQLGLVDSTRKIRVCKETLKWGGSLGRLRQVFSGQSTFAQMSVGKRTWRIEPDQYAAIRRWLDRLAMTEAEAARAEEAEQKAAADARAAEKARLDPYRADVRAAVEKALKAARSVPKKQYATTGEKLKWRTFDREIEAVVKKHGLDPRDLEELLKDYPDFKARSKIQ